MYTFALTISIDYIYWYIEYRPRYPSIDVDCLGETVLFAIQRLTGLRSLRWRAPTTPCFDALPDIFYRNPKLSIIRGSRDFFSGLVPGHGGVVHKIERLLAKRINSQINDTIAIQCTCGFVRFSRQCPIPHCERSFSPPRLPNSMYIQQATLDQDLVNLRTILSNPSDQRLHHNAPFWYGMASRFIRRLEVEIVREEASEQQLLLLRRDIQAANLRISEMRYQQLALRDKLAVEKEHNVDTIEMRGALADEIEKNRQFQATCELLQQQLLECKEELADRECMQADQERKINTTDINSLTIDQLRSELAASKATCRYLEQQRRCSLLKAA